jgi:hypothetical protein
LFARTATADEPIAGTWKVVSCVAEDLETKEQMLPYGQYPGGEIVFTPEKRIIALLMFEGRKGGQSEAERAAAFSAMYLIAGTYRVEGSKFFYTVEVSDQPALIGREREREFKIEGNRLTVNTIPDRLSRWSRGHLARSIVVFERAAQ